jgi:hypothetical protein
MSPRERLLAATTFESGKYNHLCKGIAGIPEEELCGRVRKRESQFLPASYRDTATRQEHAVFMVRYTVPPECSYWTPWPELPCFDIGSKA